jgi:hypothetical protein
MRAELLSHLSPRCRALLLALTADALLGDPPNA